VTGAFNQSLENVNLPTGLQQLIVNDGPDVHPGVVTGPCRGMVELCCAADSALCAAAGARGLDCCRITETERFDLASGLMTARRFIAERQHTDSWSALPCTAWCTWQYINEAKLGPAFAARLGWRRRQSLKMVKHATLCGRDAICRGGGAHFEWPRRARGWQRRPVQQMVALLQLQLADFDGCAFGVLAGPETLALKPWRVATSRPQLAAALRAWRCDGTHVHGSLSGRWAL